MAPSRASPTKRNALRERGRAEEVRIGLHRVALGDAAAAVDAERLLVDHVHPLLRDDVLLLGRAVEPRLEVGLDRLHLLPEGIHVDDEVLDDRQVAHRGDHRDVAVRDDVRDPRLAREHGAPVDAHAARAADHHPAALAVRERAVDLVLDDVERVEQRRFVGDVDLVRLEGAVARGGVVAPDLQLDLHAGSIRSSLRGAPSGHPNPPPAANSIGFVAEKSNETVPTLCQIRAISTTSPSAPTSSCAPRGTRAAARHRPRS